MSFDLYQHAVAATVDIYTETGRLNNIVAISLSKVFFVTFEGGSVYPGTFRFNQERDLNGSGTATIGISGDNKLTVTMRRDGDMEAIALFTSTDDVTSERPPPKEHAGDWQFVVPITQNVLTREEWKSKENMVAMKIPPDVPYELREKRRWLQIIVRNETDFEIRMTGNYFGWGRYDQKPVPRLASFSMDAFTACVGDNSWFTGVAGATTYQINMGNTHHFDFGIGYCNPYIGPYQVGLVATSDPQEVYDATTSPGASLTTTITYIAQDGEPGNTVFFRLHISAIAGQKPEFVITEDRFYSTV